MQLRDLDGGGSGTAVRSNCTVDAPCIHSGSLDPSSTRSIPAPSRLTPDGGVSVPRNQLLLAWLLLLYRNNDDGLSRVNWGYRSRESRSCSSVADRTLELGLVPFTNSDSISKALEVVSELEAASSTQVEDLPGPVVYFNQGGLATQRSHEKLSGIQPREFTYQIEVTVLEKQMIIKSQWDRTAISYRLAIAQLDSFVDILTIILDQPCRPISDAIGPTPKDLEQLWTWNAVLPPNIDRCMHDIIAEQAALSPDTLAIQSWDGDLTYRRIDDLSTRLAFDLLDLGVQVGTAIPLCFEKSKWTAVAVLAVMKAGAAFALTDPSQPEARLRTITEQIGATLIISSQSQSDLARRIAPQATVVVVSDGFFEHEEAIHSTTTLPTVPLSSPLYIIFTSGSTGKPKGVVCSHENYTSGAIPRADLVGYRSHSRVFDFASYAFDVSIDCMLCTLANGGCLCTPTDEERMNDLSGAIRNSKVNMAHMTPSVARVLDPDIIPSLEVLGLGGEAVSAGDASDWSRTTKVIIAYGPSECTVGCTINGNARISTNIGKGTGGLTWIVDPDDHDRLMPVGAVGELLVEGPVVGLGYLNEPEKTAQVFIEDPAWLLAGGGPARGRHGRLYKTGDLVRYDPDGSGAIVFVGRKDQQVKLRGQRVELAEVEHHLRGVMPSGVKVVAEVIKPGGGEPTLVAFVVEETVADTTGTDNDIITFSQEFSQAIAGIDISLGAEVPRYMVPSAYIPLEKMPSLVSGKTDRKRLREMGSAMSREQVARLRVNTAEKGEPESEMEKALHKIWSSVLGCQSEFGLYDSFFALGGDSLRAMRLVAAARGQGIALTVASIFNFPTLKDMAVNATSVSKDDREVIPAFSLLEDGWSSESARAETAKLCGIEESIIEDIYPCTPLQEGLMALSAKVKEAYIAQRVVDLEDSAIAEKLRAAFDIAAADSPILRTRIVQVPSQGLLQVVVKEDIPWFLGDNLQEYLAKDRDESMDLGKPLVRYALITEKEASKVNFVLTMHHALYDGWSMPLVVERVNSAFDGQKMERPAEFKDFIKYLKGMDREAADAYWQEQLQGATGPQFPPLPWPGYQTQADSLLEVYVPLSGRPASNTTVATVIRGAWAYVAAQYTASTDVVFGETLTGRNAPISGAEEIEGPMITTVPLRIQIEAEASVADYLQGIHDQTVLQIPYEHTGLQHIRRVSPDALEACELRAGLVLHPSAEDDKASGADLPANRLVPAGDAEASQEALKFNTYGLMLVCSLDTTGFLVMASFDSKTVERPMMERALAQFAQVSQQLCEMTETPLGDVQYLTLDDQVDLWRLSTADPQSVGGNYPGTAAVWIVDSNGSGRLVPPGAVGELVVVSAGDLPLPTIDEPSWLESEDGQPLPPSAPKFYKTGRLAKLSEEGTVIYASLTSDKALPQNKRLPSAKRISATSSKQRRLRELWSHVLRLPDTDIGLNDNFFRLGGDSISAMKLVSEARLGGLRLTVTQVFQNRTLYDMANILQDAEPTQTPESQTKAIAPLELLDVVNADNFVAESVRPQLADSTWKIVDVFPTRPLQEIAVRGTTQLPRYSARYEAMYFEEDVNRDRLFQSCQELVSRNEILRTVFVEHGGDCFNVVLEDLKTTIVEYEIDGDVESFTKQLCNLDIQTRMPLGSAFIKWFFVQSSSGKSALIFRISHAQYDEICLPLCLRQLSALHEGKPVPSALPFSSFVGHVVKQNIPQSIEYWREMLQGSSLSVLRPETAIDIRDHFAIQKTFDISARSKDVTIATLPTAAWALCLARRLAVRDVTFGEVVSGRNIDFPNADVVMGPCWQYVPVRVKFEPDWTVLDLLNLVQNQHIASSAFEGMGLKEIVKNCTDWPSATDWFDSVVHQDVEHVQSLDFSSASGRMETIYPHAEPLREWKIQAFPEGDKLTLEIVTFQSWGGFAKDLLEDLGEALEFLVQQPGAVLFASDASASS